MPTIFTRDTLDADKFKAATGADRDVAVAQIQGNAAAWHDRVDLYKSARSLQFLIVLTLIWPIMHQSMIYLDSSLCNSQAKREHECLFVGRILGMPWQIAKAPSPYDEREWLMIASLLGINTALGLGIGALRIWRGK